MKIEIGESLFYSWLRHVKDCQIVQTNWKVSPQWDMTAVEELRTLMQYADSFFAAKYGYAVFKQHTMERLLRQGECDVLGMSLQQDGSIEYHAVDVAFHENGLLYGDTRDTVERIIKKCLRTAMCLRGYLKAEKAVIVFASPKINPAQLAPLAPCVNDMNSILQMHGFDYQVRLIANAEFETQVLKPILRMSEEVADTAELFMRSYQMYRMFTSETAAPIQKESSSRVSRTQTVTSVPVVHDDIYAELKVGQIAKKHLREALEAGCATEEEVRLMQTREYSREYFGLSLPVLAKADTEFEWVRYYSTPLNIRGETYYMCSQWVESAVNNDRPFLIAWLEAHRKPEG